MSRYTVMTEVEFLPQIPAFDAPEVDFGSQEFLPEIAWQTPVLLPATFAAPRKQLLAALKVATSAVPRRTPKAILQNVRLSINGTVEIAATDQEQGVIVTRDYGREGDRCALVNAAALQSTLTKIKAEEVTLTIGESALLVASNGATTSIPLGEPPAEFPQIANMSEERVSHHVNAEELADALRQTMFAADAESTRYALGGVLFDLRADGVSLVATDTRRLAVRHLSHVDCVKPQLCEELAKQQAIVVPLATCKTLLKAIDTDCAETVRIAVGESGNDIQFGLSETVVYSRLIEGRFPRYQDVVPNSFPHCIGFDRAEFTAAIETVLLATDGETRGCDFVFQGGHLDMTVESLSTGNKSSATVCYDASSVFGNPPSITFDPRFILDWFKSLPKHVRNVTLQTSNGESCAAFRAADDSQGVYILMPLSHDR